MKFIALYVCTVVSFHIHMYGFMSPKRWYGQFWCWDLQSKNPSPSLSLLSDAIYIYTVSLGLSSSNSRRQSATRKFGKIVVEIRLVFSVWFDNCWSNLFPFGRRSSFHSPEQILSGFCASVGDQLETVASIWKQSPRSRLMRPYRRHPESSHVKSFSSGRRQTVMMSRSNRANLLKSYGWL